MCPMPLKPVFRTLILPLHGLCKFSSTNDLSIMKKYLTLLAFAGLFGAANAQTTTTSTTPTPEAEKVEKNHSCAGHAKAEAGKAACCAGKEGAKASADAEGETKMAGGCCAGKASAAKSCHGKGAKADAGHDHDKAMGEMKEHACTDSCKEGAHALACGEKGHVCLESCHAKM